MQTNYQQLTWQISQAPGIDINNLLDWTPENGQSNRPIYIRKNDLSPAVDNDLLAYKKDGKLHIISIGKHIGGGTHGEVYKGMDLLTGVAVAVKFNEFERGRDKSGSRALLHKGNSAAHQAHEKAPGLAKLMAFGDYQYQSEQQTHYYCVMELATSSYTHALKKAKQDKQITLIFQAIKLAMDLERSNLSHGELDAKNLMCRENGDFIAVDLEGFGEGDLELPEQINTYIYEHRSDLNNRVTTIEDLYACHEALKTLFPLGLSKKIHDEMHEQQEFLACHDSFNTQILDFYLGLHRLYTHHQGDVDFDSKLYAFVQREISQLQMDYIKLRELAREAYIAQIIQVFNDSSSRDLPELRRFKNETITAIIKAAKQSYDKNEKTLPEHQLQKLLTLYASEKNEERKKKIGDFLTANFSDLILDNGQIKLQSLCRLSLPTISLIQTLLNAGQIHDSQAQLETYLNQYLNAQENSNDALFNILANHSDLFSHFDYQPWLQHKLSSLENAELVKLLGEINDWYTYYGILDDGTPDHYNLYAKILLEKLEHKELIKFINTDLSYIGLHNQFLRQKLIEAMLDIPSDYIRVLQDINYSQTESLFIDEFFDKNNQEVKEKFVCLASYFPFERLSDADYNEIQSHGENIATYTLINLFNESPNLIKHVILDQEILEETDLSTFAKFFAEHGNKLKQESIANFIKNNEEYIGRLQTLLTESDNPASKQIKAHSVPVTQQVEKSADPINELQQHSESPPDTRVEELAMAIEEQANRIEKEQRRLPKWLQNAKANIKMDDLRALAKTTRAGKATVLTTEQWGTVTKQTARFGFCENKESDTESALSNYRPS